MGIGTSGFLVTLYGLNMTGHLLLVWLEPQSSKEWGVPILLGLLLNWLRTGLVGGLENGATRPVFSLSSL